MKKLTFLFAALSALFFSMSASAQHRIGIIGGLNIAEFEVASPGASTEISNKTVFGLGGVVVLRLSDDFSLHLQPMYQQKGALVADLDDNIEFPFTLAFLELPVFLKAEFGSTVKPYLMVGPTVGFLLSSDVEGDVEGIAFKGDLKDVTESIDLGLGFGAGVSYPLSTITLFVEGRYALGLSNMQKGGTFELTAGPIVEEITWDKEEDAYKNRGLQIMAGATFPLGN
ncbi:MAG: outer membrane beta-barrel protein [bacterium]